MNKIVMVGAFPPPIHGMAAVNESVREQLSTAGADLLVINVSALGLHRGIWQRLGRMPRVLRGLVLLGNQPAMRGRTLYMSVSGGFGQIYELLFVLLARLYGMRLYLHHHSFAYLDRSNWLMAWIVRATKDGTTVHVTQSPRMAKRLKVLYGVKHALAVSNSVFFVKKKASHTKPRSVLRTLGYISNIVEEKGIFEFLDLIAAVQELGLLLSAKVAGPFQDSQTERKVRTRIHALPALEYVGPMYGVEKDSFFSEIDVLVFPTRYANETEGIVNHEAMSRGIPVIAYGRGCIPEIIGDDCGRVIAPSEQFVPAALAQIQAWLDDPIAFESVSGMAAQRFAETYAQNKRRWDILLNDLTGEIHFDAKVHTS